MEHREPSPSRIDEEAELLAAHSRRKFLGIAGSLIVGGGLAACGQDGGGTAVENTVSSASETTTTVASAPAASGSAVEAITEVGLQPQAIAPEPRVGPSQFVRIFEESDLRGQVSSLADALVELGQPGGILDANESVEAGALALLNQPELSADNPDNPTMQAGATFFGQFLNHDITHDAGARLGRPTGLERSANLRTARLDLDSVYGRGLNGSRELYDDNFRFIVESGGFYEDLPRDAQGAAIIGDNRNDENLITSGMHAAFLLFHNNLMEALEEMGLSSEEAFPQARQLARWHYQWITLHEFLPAIVGQEMVDDILANGRQFYTPAIPQIPVEFQTSAYRFGHSLVRASYQANSSGDNGDPFIAMVFDVSLPASSDPDDLRGGHRAPRRYIDWESFFDFEGVQTADRAKLIDTKFTSPLFRLPSIVLEEGLDQDVGVASLATRNLLRHLTWEVATGQTVANRMGVEPLSAADLELFNGFGADFAAETPLWLYVLREAEVINGGTHLGPVGGRIVAEVIIGLLEMDSASFVSAEPNWVPTLPAYGEPETFNMADLLTIAGVDPRSRRS